MRYKCVSCGTVHAHLGVIQDPDLSFSFIDGPKGNEVRLPTLRCVWCNHRTSYATALRLYLRLGMIKSGNED